MTLDALLEKFIRENIVQFADETFDLSATVVDSILGFLSREASRITGITGTGITGTVYLIALAKTQRRKGKARQCGSVPLAPWCPFDKLRAGFV